MASSPSLVSVRTIERVVPMCLLLEWSTQGRVLAVVLPMTTLSVAILPPSPSPRAPLTCTLTSTRLFDTRSTTSAVAVLNSGMTSWMTPRGTLLREKVCPSLLQFVVSRFRLAVRW